MQINFEFLIGIYLCERGCLNLYPLSYADLKFE